MREYNQSLFIVFLIFFASGLNRCFAQADRPYFKQLTRDAGLSANKINCVAQDKFGFIWIGTEDGISRYDGVRFKIYKTEQGLVDNYVNVISCDPANGNLWIGTRQGMSFFNRKEERFYNTPRTIAASDAEVSEASIFKIIFDSRKRLWVGTSAGLFYFNQPIPANSVPLFKNARLITKEVTNDVLEDSYQRVWIGSSNSLKYYSLHNGVLTVCAMPRKQVNVRSIYEDSRRNIWISTGDQGVYQLSKSVKVLNHFKKGASLMTNNVTGVVEDEHGKIWIGAKDGGGLFQFNYSDQTVRLISARSKIPGNPNSITSNSITAIYRDKKGYIWVGTYAGLNYYDPYRKNFAHYKINFEPDGLFNSNVRCFYQDSDGKIWVGTRDEGGISIFNPQTGTFKNYPSNSKSNSGLTDGNVLTITGIDDARLLIGTNNNGLFVFDKRSGTFSALDVSEESDPALGRGRIGMVHKDQFGKVWIATNAAVYTLDLKAKKLRNEVKMIAIREMLEYNQDEIYFISLFDGMYHYNRKTGRLIHYSRSEGSNSLSNNRVNSIRKDRNGNLWIATNNGLDFFNVRTKRFRTYTVKDGLPANIICGILIDGKDNLWLSTVNGLVKCAPDARVLNTFNVRDGLQGNEFEKGVCLSTREGNMLFGGVNGFNYFHPDDITPNPLVPSVVLTDLKIFNKAVTIGSEDSPLKQSISFEKEIILNHNQSFLEFEFAGLSFTCPENNQYAYKLEGLEKDWNISGNKTSASYTGLQPGKYIFRVRASNNDGAWSKDELALEVEILPPWWQTIPFQLAVLFALAGAVVWFYSYRTRSLRMQKRKLDLLVRERTEVIRQQNQELEASRDEVMKLNSRIRAISEYRLQFFTNISHEFRTPLTLIIGPLNKLLSGTIDTKEVKENLLVIKRNAGRLLHLINELMDFRSLENRNLPLRVTQVNLNVLTEEIAALFVELAREKEIEFIVEHDQELVEGWADAIKLQKVIFNLISNAFNYTAKGGRIGVYTCLSTRNASHGQDEVVLGKHIPGSEYFEIRVKDSGVGIPEDSLSKVFKQFYRESITNIDTKGTGLGLSIVKELVRLHKGIITVKSQVGVGSEFSVRIPVNKDAYPTEAGENTNGLPLIYNKEQVSDLLGSTVAEAEPTDLNEKVHQHILVVEDNEELLLFITRQLSASYKVSQARNGAQGLEAALKLMPDLVVSDLVMPEMTGIELLKKLKDNVRTAHIAVVLLTARADVESQIEGIEAGADDYISKPFDIDVFKLKVRNLIQSRLRLRKLFSTSVDDIPSEAELSSPDSEFLEKAITLIKENIANEDFGVSELVDRMCVSSSLLQKKIARLTNHTPTEFITLYRMKKALELMKQPGATVAEVARQTGFRDPYYFSRSFKKQFGKSPTLFIASLQTADPKKSLQKDLSAG